MIYASSTIVRYSDRSQGSLASGLASEFTLDLVLNEENQPSSESWALDMPQSLVNDEVSIRA